MAKKQSVKTEVFVIENCILSFPHIFTPQQVNNQGEPKYSAALLVDAKHAAIIMNKAKEIATSAFENNETGYPNFRWPVTPANQNKNYMNNPRTAGLYIVNSKAAADYPPQVVDENRQKVLDKSKIYAGCIVAAAINLYTYNNMGNIGVGVGLSAIMKTGDGEALGGGPVDVNEVFGGIQPTAAGGPTPFFM